MLSLVLFPCPNPLSLSLSSSHSVIRLDGDVHFRNLLEEAFETTQVAAFCVPKIMKG